MSTVRTLANTLNLMDESTDVLVLEGDGRLLDGVGDLWEARIVSCSLGHQHRLGLFQINGQEMADLICQAVIRRWDATRRFIVDPAGSTTIRWTFV